MQVVRERMSWLIAMAINFDLVAAREETVSFVVKLSNQIYQIYTPNFHSVTFLHKCLT